jgi:hypothetical protein
MAKPAERWVGKYQARTSVARPDYEWGVQNPSRGPITAAIGAKETLMAKMAARETWDKWEAALRYVGDEGWKDAALKKGAPRYTDGVSYGLPKFTDFASKFKAHLDAGLPAIRAMPRRTLEESIAKAAAMIKHNAKFTYKKK